MAQAVDREKISCSICLDLLKEAVTIPCGHSYCMVCIKNYWEDEMKTQVCPQCRESFTPRPALVKNTMLAELVEELKNFGLPAALPDHFYAGPGDVACDLCTGRKLKAIKSCLVCMVSYCEQHLQPHYDVAPLKKHKLIEATAGLQDNICPRHNEVMKIFCCTDQHCICYDCFLEEHKSHETVAAKTEREERQTELGLTRQKIQQRIQDREKDFKALEEKVEAINLAADEVAKNSEKTLKDVLEKIISEVNRTIRSQQNMMVSRVGEFQEKIQQEITDLRTKDTDLEKLSSTEDHIYFLNKYRSLSCLTESTNGPGIDLQPQTHFEDVSVAVSQMSDKLLTTLTEQWGKKKTKEEVQEPSTRAEFLKYACQIKLDPDTANGLLRLSMNNRKVTLRHVLQLYSLHPKRFTGWWQVLSCNGLTGQCYWEVKWSGRVLIAVAYKDISRTGNKKESGFGNNEKSWALECQGGRVTFIHNNVSTAIRGPASSRIGVYLDHKAGVLSFYSVTTTMNLLHRVKTKFSQPLYPGIWLPQTVGDTAEFCDI
ncbi:tripartite motif-containing protein 16-like [Mugil cephalus]|uniref:tripartite motif-containing protein 16-like n=1 Tax=Mugil cephalus TaxID=48193 RepID=UPI001FB63407|nr:tripartite motif-containing protein 16-like [Mugil cephalus]